MTAPFILVAGATGDLGGRSVRSLKVLIPVVKLVAAEKPNAVFPAWQGMQYT